MKNLKLLFALCAMITIYSCSSEEQDFESVQNESIELRGEDECDCEISILVEGCKLSFVSSGECAIDEVLWVHGTIYSYNHTITASSYQKEYCVYVTFADGCVETKCITLPGCKDCYQESECEVTISETACNLSVGLSSGCAQGGYWTTPSGVFQGTGFPLTEEGFYCFYNVDNNGCWASDCYYNPGCEVDPCDGCTPSINVDEDNCAAFVGFGFGDCQASQYSWTINGKSAGNSSSVDITESGTYCLTVLYSNGIQCTTCEEIDIPQCSCTPCEFTKSVMVVDSREFGFTTGLEYRTCDPNETFNVCEELAYIIKNESGCSASDLINLYNIKHPNYAVTQSTLQEVIDCIESELQSIPGCEDTEVYISTSSPWGLDYQIEYNCHDCPLKYIAAKYGALNANNSCTKIYSTYSKNAGSFTTCGKCW